MMPVLRTRNPIDMMDLFDRELGRLSRYWNDSNGSSSENAFASYPVDIWEDADQLHVEAELPGYTKDDINITMEKGVLTIAAERTKTGDATKDNGNPLLHERRYSRYFRSFTLPTAVDEDAIEANFNNGVLNITLPKRAEVKPRKITVN